MIKIAIDCGINWDWFLAYSLNDDGTITRHGETRFHHFDEKQGAAINARLGALWAGSSYRLEETRVTFGETRMAHGVTLSGKYYPFAAPVERFSDIPFDWSAFAE